MKSSAFILGFIFAFLLKRGGFCFAGTIEDVVLEKHPYNLCLFISLVSTEATVYHIMLMSGVLPPVVFKYFSLLATSLGGFIFGIGAVLCSGCITGQLIKVGDGRITGIISSIFFMIGVATARSGALKGLSQFLFSQTLVQDDLHGHLASLAPILFGLLALTSYAIMFWHVKREKSFPLPRRYACPVRHLFCEKLWKREIVVILLGLLLAMGFYFSNMTGRNDSFAITAPLTAIFSLLVNGKGTIDWAVILVSGIVAGSVFTTCISGEFYLVSSSAISILKHIVGGFLMGLGAVWAGGCIVSNGLVGTAQLSLRACLAFSCMIGGIWLASLSLSTVLYRRKM